MHLFYLYWVYIYTRFIHVVTYLYASGKEIAASA